MKEWKSSTLSHLKFVEMFSNFNFFMENFVCFIHLWCSITWTTYLISSVCFVWMRNTSSAWQNFIGKIISDYSSFQRKKGNLVNKDSVSLHLYLLNSIDVSPFLNRIKCTYKSQLERVDMSISKYLRISIIVKYDILILIYHNSNSMYQASHLVFVIWNFSCFLSESLNEFHVSPKSKIFALVKQTVWFAAEKVFANAVAQQDALNEVKGEHSTKKKRIQKEGWA